MSTKKDRLRKLLGIGFRTGYEYGKREEQMIWPTPCRRTIRARTRTTARRGGLFSSATITVVSCRSTEATRRLTSIRCVAGRTDARRQEIKIGDQVIQYHHTAPNEYTIFEADEYNRDSGSFMRVLPDTL